MTITEGDIDFIFDDSVKLCKFDAQPFYQDDFNKYIDGGKGVDIIFETDSIVCFMEIKDFRKDYVNNKWRTIPNNRSKQSQIAHVAKMSKDSLDIEIPKKVMATIDCLYGAWTKKEQSSRAADLIEQADFVMDSDIQNHRKRLVVLLFVEGVRDTQARKAMITLHEIEIYMKRRLKWMNCSVEVIDSNSLKSWFQVQVH